MGANSLKGLCPGQGVFRCEGHTAEGAQERSAIVAIWSGKEWPWPFSWEARDALLATVAPPQGCLLRRTVSGPKV